MTRVVARGWATVDLDRAEEELRALVVVGGPFEEATRSELLGARCRRARVADPGASDGEPSWLVVLEPDTEGRLAAFLARHDEGWAATWAVGEEDASQARPGPLGPETLSAGRPASGPFRLLVAAATIEP
jgi:hypothetical protein